MVTTPPGDCPVSRPLRIDFRLYQAFPSYPYYLKFVFAFVGQISIIMVSKSLFSFKLPKIISSSPTTSWNMLIWHPAAQNICFNCLFRGKVQDVNVFSCPRRCGRPIRCSIRMGFQGEIIIDDILAELQVSTLAANVWGKHYPPFSANILTCSSFSTLHSIHGARRLSPLF